MSSQSRDQKPLAVVILAAGESRRMGTPKVAVEWRKKTFAQLLLEATRHPRVGITRIVIGAHQDEVRRKLRWDARDVVLNSEWQNGQLSSIQTGIRSLPEGETSGMILCPVDHPMVRQEVVGKLIEAFDASGKAVVLPVYEGRRGHPVIFRADLYAEILSASPEIGARQVVWAHAQDLLEVPTDWEGVVLNINDQQALEAWTRKFELKLSN